MKRRNAFTLIELLVVIGIIVILAGMLTFGTRAIIIHGKSHATEMSLENLQSALAEFENTAGKSALISTTYLASPGDVSAQIYGSTTDTTPLGDPDLGRWKSDAVVNTQKMMRRMKAIPKNREGFAQLSNYMQPQTDGATYCEAVIPPAVESPTTPQHPISVSKNLGTGYGIPSPEIPVDAWGNPIIFVPSQGLILAGTFDGKVRYFKEGVVMSDGTNCYRAMKSGATQAKLGDPKWWETVPGGMTIAASPGHRAFFASAGPDGDFRSPDDNVYSFARD